MNARPHQGRERPQGGRDVEGAKTADVRTNIADANKERIQRQDREEAEKKKSEREEQDRERDRSAGYSISNLFKNLKPPRFFKNVMDLPRNVHVRMTRAFAPARKAIETFTSRAWVTAGFIDVGVAAAEPVGPEQDLDMNDSRVQKNIETMNDNNELGYYYASPDCRKGTTFNQNINYSEQQKVAAEAELREEWKVPMEQAERVMNNGGAATFEQPTGGLVFRTHWWAEYATRNKMHEVTFVHCGLQDHPTPGQPAVYKPTTLWTSVEKSVTSKFTNKYGACKCGGNHVKLQGTDKYGRVRTKVARLYSWKLSRELAVWARPYCCATNTPEQTRANKIRATAIAQTSTARQHGHGQEAGAGQGLPAPTLSIATIDSAADSTIMSSDAVAIITTSTSKMKVEGYIPGSVVVLPICTIATITRTASGEQVILIFHDVGITSEFDTIIDYHQLRYAGWDINMDAGAKRGNDTLPFKTANTDVGMEIRKPTQQEIEILRHIDIIPKLLRPWNKEIYLQNNSDITNAGPGTRRVRHIECLYTSNLEETVSAPATPPDTPETQLDVDENGVTWTTRATEIRATRRNAKRDKDTIRPECLGWASAETRQKTAEATTHHGVVDARSPMRMIFSHQFLQHRLEEGVAWDLKVCNAAGKRSIEGYGYCVVFIGVGKKGGGDGSGFISSFPLKRKTAGSLATSLDWYSRQFGVPAWMRGDGAPEQLFTTLLEAVRSKYRIGDPQITEREHPNQNPAEMAIALVTAIMQRVRHGAHMHYKITTPAKLWWKLFEYATHLHNITATARLGWITPWQARHGTTPDRSSLRFGWLQPVFFVDMNKRFPDSKYTTGRWVGHAINRGSFLCSYVLVDDTQKIVAVSAIGAREEMEKVKEQETNENNGHEENEEGGLKNPRVYTEEEIDDLLEANNNIADIQGNDNRTEEGKESEKDHEWEEQEGTQQPEEQEEDNVEGKELSIWRDGKELTATVGKAANDDGDRLPAHEVTIKGGEKVVMADFEIRREIAERESKERTYESIIGHEIHKKQGGKGDMMVLKISWGKDDGGDDIKDTLADLEQFKRDDPEAVMRYFLDFEKNHLRGTFKVLERDAWGWARRRAEQMDVTATTHTFHREEEEETEQDTRVRDLKVTNWGNLDEEEEEQDNDKTYREAIEDMRCRSRRMRACDLDTGYANEVAGDWWSVRNVKKTKVDWGAPMETKFGQDRPRTTAEAKECDRLDDKCSQRDKLAGGMRWFGKESASENEIRSLDAQDCFTYLEAEEEGRLLGEGYSRGEVTLAFDIKASGVKKMRLAMRGDKQPDLGQDVYASVLDSVSARLAMVAGAANGQKCTVADISTAFVHARLTGAKIFLRCGEEFGEDKKGKIAVLNSALYGLRESSKLWQDHMATVMRSVGFTRSAGDENLWMRTEKQLVNGRKVRELVGIYVDDLLCISTDGEAIIAQLERCLKIKFASTPDVYLGGELRYDKTGLLTMTANGYITEMVAQLEQGGKRMGLRDLPMRNDDHPEFLVGEEDEDLNKMDTRFFQRLVGQVLWVGGGLGRIDVSFAAASLSRFATNPKQGHLTRALECIEYLNKHKDLGILIDPSDPQELPEADHNARILLKGAGLPEVRTEAEIREALAGGLSGEDHLQREIAFNEAVGHVREMEKDMRDWEEEMDENDPVPMGKPLKITAFVDANWAHDYKTRKSITGIIIYVGSTPVYWKSTRQSSISSSTFEAEMAGLRTVAEVNRAIRIGMRSHGMPINGATKVMCDNMSAILQATKHDAVLKKRHTAISWFRVREAVKRNEMDVCFVPSEWQLADILTKPVGGIIFNRLIAMIMHRVITTIETTRA